MSKRFETDFEEVILLFSETIQPFVFLNVAFVKLILSANAYEPIEVTLLGMTILVKFLHSENAYEPILVTPSGIIILVKLLQLKKAPLLIFVTLLGIVISVNVPIYDTKDISIPSLYVINPFSSVFR